MRRKMEGWDCHGLLSRYLGIVNPIEIIAGDITLENCKEISC
jgi:hypothetical protein